MFRKIKSLYASYINSRFESWTGLAAGEISVYRTNRFFTFLGMSSVTYVAYFVYSYHPVLANALSDGFLFFHFPKIFNLKVPEPTFFANIAKYFLLSIIGFHWISFQLIALEYFFSCLYIAKTQKTLIYIQSNLWTRKIHILKEKKIQCELEDNLVTRIFGIGTLNLNLGNGELWKIRSISRVRFAMKEIISFDKK